MPWLCQSRIVFTTPYHSSTHLTIVVWTSIVFKQQAAIVYTYIEIGWQRWSIHLLGLRTSAMCTYIQFLSIDVSTQHTRQSDVTNCVSANEFIGWLPVYKEDWCVHTSMVAWLDAVNPGHGQEGYWISTIVIQKLDIVVSSWSTYRYEEFVVFVHVYRPVKARVTMYGSVVCITTSTLLCMQAMYVHMNKCSTSYCMWWWPPWASARNVCMQLVSTQHTWQSNSLCPC